VKTHPADAGQRPGVDARLAALDEAVVNDAATRPVKERDAAHRRWSVLGTNVACPLGVAASPLTRSAEHLAYFARRGFEVLTFKTVRSVEWAPHRAPNWVYIENGDAPLPLDADLTAVTARGDAATCVPSGVPFSTANSYGVPSPPPREWQEELAEARTLTGDDALLIASVQGSPEIYRERRALVTDFVRTARLAAAAGPSAIEINLSCPNTVDFPTGSIRPPLCTSNPALTREVVVQVREALPDAKLVAKLSFMPASVLGALVASFATATNGIAGINTLPATVLDHEGKATFFGVENDRAQIREVAGLSGASIREFSANFVESLVSLKELNGWEYDVLAMGGVMGLADVRSLLDRGAAAVQVVTGMLDGSTLAQEFAAEETLAASA
jgi:dihydroorotate dehydrogenase